jgi:Holliday junction resolvase RusA-like endonuclease
MRLAFFVPGVPQPKGSGSRIASGVYLEAGTGPSRRRKKLWYSRVADYARRASHGQGIGPRIDSAVTARVVFRFPIPKSRLRGKRAMAVGSPHVSAPDADKLARSLGDSLTRSGVIADDRLIATWAIWKIYAMPGDEGADVLLTW